MMTRNPESARIDYGRNWMTGGTVQRQRKRAKNCLVAQFAKARENLETGPAEGVSQERWDRYERRVTEWMTKTVKRYGACWFDCGRCSGKALS